eukprot:TRINITY_DN5097_c0_g1_i8.p1 TRINITY_DN5097_c0_g1~~TRINITY_DN5097_c0_g1_i8.p1  ORF type:complete len:775 (+),score=324.74 TRINITY_DN5097_c0_g1_i8:96-2420(+)
MPKKDAAAEGAEMLKAAREEAAGHKKMKTDKAAEKKAKKGEKREKKRDKKSAKKREAETQDDEARAEKKKREAADREQREEAEKKQREEAEKKQREEAEKQQREEAAEYKKRRRLTAKTPSSPTVRPKLKQRSSSSSTGSDASGEKKKQKDDDEANASGKAGSSSSSSSSSSGSETKTTPVKEAASTVEAGQKPLEEFEEDLEVMKEKCKLFAELDAVTVVGKLMNVGKITEVHAEWMLATVGKIPMEAIKKVGRERMAQLYSLRARAANAHAPEDLKKKTGAISAIVNALRKIYKDGIIDAALNFTGLDKKRELAGVQPKGTATVNTFTKPAFLRICKAAADVQRSKKAKRGSDVDATLASEMNMLEKKMDAEWHSQVDGFPWLPELWHTHIEGMNGRTSRGLRPSAAGTRTDVSGRSSVPEDAAAAAAECDSDIPEWCSRVCNKLRDRRQLYSLMRQEEIATPEEFVQLARVGDGFEMKEQSQVAQMTTLGRARFLATCARMQNANNAELNEMFGVKMKCDEIEAPAPAELEQKCADTTARADASEAKAAQEKRRADELEDKAAVEKQRADTLARDLAEANARAGQLEQKLADEKQRADELEKKHADEKARADASEKNASDEKRRADELEEKAADEKQRADKLERDSAEANARAEQLEKTRAAEKQRADESEKKHADEKARADASEQKAADEKRRADELERREAEAKQRADELEKISADEKARAAELEKSCANQKARADAFEQTAAAAKKKADELAAAEAGSKKGKGANKGK